MIFALNQFQIEFTFMEKKIMKQIFILLFF